MMTNEPSWAGSLELKVNFLWIDGRRLTQRLLLFQNHPVPHEMIEIKV